MKGEENETVVEGNARGRRARKSGGSEGGAGAECLDQGRVQCAVPGGTHKIAPGWYGAQVRVRGSEKGGASLLLMCDTSNFKDLGGRKRCSALWKRLGKYKTRCIRIPLKRTVLWAAARVVERARTRAEVAKKRMVGGGLW